MHQATVIGLHGRARAGKDTVANFILSHRGGYLYSFADPIRAMLVPLGIDMSDPYWQARKEDVIPALGVSPRRLMQTLGTEWGRQIINPDLWLILAKQRLLNFGPGMVIADVRFENEASWVRSQGGRVIHIERPNNVAIEAHASEAGVEFKGEEGDIKIVNGGTLEDLQNIIREVFDGV
jgi:hypothetical protein